MPLAEIPRLAGPKGFALEIFAGSGRFSHSWRQQAPWGLPIFEVDVNYHSSHDLSRRAAQRLILGWIRSGCCKAIWLATPCSTFSRARDSGAGPPRLRSDQQPLGLDELSEGDRVKVEVANELCRFSAKALLCCLERGVPAALENPASSRLWLTPYMQAASHRRGVRETVTDFCMDGAPWRKRTKIMYVHLDLSVAARVCHSARNEHKCDRTGRKHVVLRGKGPDGRWLTKTAEPYPRALCRRIVSQYRSRISYISCSDTRHVLTKI